MRLCDECEKRIEGDFYTFQIRKIPSRVTYHFDKLDCLLVFVNRAREKKG